VGERIIGVAGGPRRWSPRTCGEGARRSEDLHSSRPSSDAIIRNHTQSDSAMAEVAMAEEAMAEVAMAEVAMAA
jgi:hypothetical protein